MTLKEKFGELSIDNVESKCEKIADEFVIGFGVWLSINCEQSNSKDGWWIYNSNWITTDELLEIYKKEKGL
jgi:hypothetical protein